MDVNKWQDPLLRQDVYAMFAAFFSRPEPDVAGEHALHCLQALNGELELGIAGETEKLSNWLCSGENCLDELRKEHARLFIGPFTLPAPPYGSYYLDNGRVMGDSTIDVLRHYRESGLEMADECVELPDHVSVQLDYLAALCEAEWTARQQNDSEMADALRQKHDVFMSKHILNWVPRFTHKVKETDTVAYYQVVCAALDAFLQTVYSQGGMSSCS